MRTRKIAGIVIAATAACLVFAGQASAYVSPPDGGSWDYVWTTSDTAHGGTIYIEKHGDLIQLCDTAADGLAARADIAAKVDGAYTNEYSLVASGGNGTCVYKDASDGGNYNLPENTSIWVLVWVGTEDAGLVSHYYDNNA